MDSDGDEHETMQSARCRLSSSLGDEWCEQRSSALEYERSAEDDGELYERSEEVFIAVTGDVYDGMGTLLWVMRNLANCGSRVVIAHVHSPTRAIHKLRAKADHASMRPEEVHRYRNLVRERAEKNMDEYVLTAKRARRGLKIDKVMIEMDDVADGLVKLIALYGITKLVMGAAADQHYSKEMKTPKSKTALKLMETVAPLCKIWFTCNGNLICTREMNGNFPAMSRSPVQSNTTPPSVCSISSQMRSMALKNEANSKGYNSGSMFESAKTDWDLFFRPDCDREEEEQILDEQPYVKHQEVYTKANLCKEETNEESNKRRKAELDLLSALQRVKDSEDSYLHEASQRKEIEKTLAKQRLEIDEMKRRRYALHDELQDSKKQRLMLEQHITQIEFAAKDYVKEITDFFTEESCLETKKRRKLETDLLFALQRARKMETLYQNEKGQRVDNDEKITRQRMEIEETKRQRDELYYELKDLKEQRVKLKPNDVSEESNRRRSAESDLLSALQKFKDLERLYLLEVRKREAMEEALAIQKEEIQETKGQLEDKHDKHMSGIKSTIKVYEEKLEKSKQFIQELQANYDKLLDERDTAVTVAEEQRQRNKHGASVTAKALNIDFSLYELQQATKGFDTTLKISESGIGSVYKGFLRNTNVAVKFLHPENLQGQQEFHEEVAFLNTVRHPNVMLLIGACQEALGLVYEFLPNGSLEDRLLCRKNMPPLTWQVRTRIIGEICSSLSFIHSHKPHPIVHGDLKPDNILLDANFVSKLRIYRLLKNFKTTKNTKGTSSDMDTKFLSTGELTPDFDVYSFGIIILRLLTGRSPQNITETVQEAIEKGHLHSIVDASAGSWPFLQASQLAHLGLRCANLSGKRRPDLVGEVWGVIEPLMKAASLNAGRPSFAASSDDTHTPASFICAILQEVMSDPHIAADGFTYEAEAIRGWLDSGHNTSPMTNLKLEHCKLTPNRALRAAILEWQQQQQQHGR